MCENCTFKGKKAETKFPLSGENCTFLSLRAEWFEATRITFTQKSRAAMHLFCFEFLRWGQGSFSQRKQLHAANDVTSSAGNRVQVRDSKRIQWQRCSYLVFAFTFISNNYRDCRASGSRSLHAHVVRDCFSRSYLCPCILILPHAFRVKIIEPFPAGSRWARNFFGLQTGASRTVDRIII